MRIGQATGLQVAFFMYAVMLLAVPVSLHIVEAAALAGPLRVAVELGTQFVLAAALIAAIAPLRRQARQWLSAPIPRCRRVEVAFVALAKPALAFAVAASIATFLWLSQGPVGVEGMAIDAEAEAAKAYSDSTLARLLFVVIVGPFFEELVFRGFIYRAFERQWGWFAAMLATSAVFGLYHAHFASAFASSVVFVCLLRRTGSLWAPIAVHMLFNLSLWWPLLGQHVFPHGVALGEASTWYFHLACLAFATVAIPAYAWMSRDRTVVAPTVFLAPDAPLPK